MKHLMKRASMALLLSSACLFANAQQTVKGTVKDASGEPMIGVTVAAGQGAGAVIDINLINQLSLECCGCDDCEGHDHHDGGCGCGHCHG